MNHMEPPSLERAQTPLPLSLLFLCLPAAASSASLYTVPRKRKTLFMCRGGASLKSRTKPARSEAIVPAGSAPKDGHDGGRSTTPPSTMNLGLVGRYPANLRSVCGGECGVKWSGCALVGCHRREAGLRLEKHRNSIQEGRRQDPHRHSFPPSVLSFNYSQPHPMDQEQRGAHPAPLYRSHVLYVHGHRRAGGAEWL
ncbi:hypothetical protein DFP73DRAFT_76560 [Morchella snyderi]|nr:hypothetical protein DFP73DRAFT_76560 [Morchella snyderi]